MLYKTSIPYIGIILGVTSAVSFFIDSWLFIGVILFSITVVLSRKFFYAVLIQDGKLILRSGIIMISQKEVLLSKINNLEMKQDPLQRYLDVADIFVYSGNSEIVKLDAMENYSSLYAELGKHLR